MKRSLKVLKSFLLVLLICLVVYIWQSLPVVCGYVAKIMCSDIFIANRNPSNIAQHEIAGFPFNLVSYTVNVKDSSVSTSVLGLAKRKAIYRKGLGATLLSGISEVELRKQTLNAPAAVSTNRDTVGFPAENYIFDTTEAGINKEQLDAAIKYAFSEPTIKKQIQTRAVLVVYNGRLIAEKYSEGYSVNSKQLGWSMTKSIINALIGILVKQGKLNINTSAPVNEWKNDNRSKITIANLMQMSSGLSYSGFPVTSIDLTNMLFKERDMSAFAINKSLKNKPGTVFYYSNGTANILSHIIRKTVGDKNYYRFPYEQLFYKIGMYNTELEVDASGTFVGSSYCYATARDWARFGLLYLNDGIWNGERILPEGWVKFTATASGAKNDSKAGKYGALWWVNQGDRNNSANRKYPHVPPDCFSCQGYEGQSVWVIPSKKLVVVRLSFEHGALLNHDLFLSKVIKALPQ